MPSDRLDSWKEIAAYLNRGVRTVVRWETDEGLPVHRLHHDERASVFAYKSELAAWRDSRTTAVHRPTVIPAVAVLPFTAVGGDPEDEYFCDGLAEELTTALSRVPGLKVIARTSSFAFKNKPADVVEISRLLRVDSLVEGAVLRSANRLRVTVRLIRSADSSSIWSERFDRASGDVFAIQSEIAEAVTDALHVRLLDQDRARFAKRHTSDPAAYDLYLRGRHLLARRTPEAIDAALGYFRQSLDRSPENALALAAIAECCCVAGFLGLRRPSEAWADARLAIDQAARLDPNLGELEAIGAYVAFAHDWNWTQAERKLSRAQELAPSYAPAALWRSFLLAVRGRQAEAESAIARAWDLDPLSLYVQTHVGLAALWARDFDRAIARFRHILATEPGFALAGFHLGRTCLITGRLEESIEVLSRAADSFPLAAGALAHALWTAVRREESDSALARLEGMSTTRYVGPMAFATACIGRAPRRAIEWLDKSLDEREGAAILLPIDPGFDPLRSVDGFERLV
ncbi:MAG: tetratricopeptide repeat protein [Acidobacteria bacterium]|nr:tetratricopeptide repeat protein [Acidobacteriota bacterium]